MNKKVSKALKKIIFLLLVFFLWWLVYKLRFWPEWLFPSPFQVLETLFKGIGTKPFIMGIIISMKRILLGFGFSILAGSILGLVLAKVKILEETLGSLILGLQTLPSICWLPLALLWFGLNESAIIFVVIMGTVLSLTISVQMAIKNIPPALIKAARMLGAKRFVLYKSVIIPAIMPSYITGLKQGWSFAWRSLMSGEMLFISAGLGQLLMLGRELNDMAQVMAVMLIIIIIGVVFDQFVFGLMEKSVYRKWGLQKNLRNA